MPRPLQFWIPGPHPPVPFFLALLPSQPLAPLWEPLPPFGPVALRWPLITVCPPEMLGPAQGCMGSFSPSFLVFYKLGNPLETEPGQFSHLWETLASILVAQLLSLWQVCVCVCVWP